MAGEIEGKQLTSSEKLAAAKKVVKLLESEVPWSDQIDVASLAIKALKGSLVVKYDGEVS
jgi:hypothetical protein